MSVARRLLIVVGLKREAQLAAQGGDTVCSGGDVGLLERRLSRLNPDIISGVVSFGLAGGLDPALAPGDLALAQFVASSRGVFGADAALTDALAAALKGVGLRLCDGVFAGVDEAVLTPEGKAALRAQTRAVAVDMESHVAARFASACGLPFAGLRAVSDPAGRALPKLAAQALTPDGGVHYGRVIAGLARSPGDLGALMEAGRDSSAAFATLKRAGRALAAL